MSNKHLGDPEFWKELFHDFTEIGIRLSTEHDLDELLRQILFEARAFSHADAGSLYVVDRNQLVFKVSQNDTLDMREGKVGQSKFHDFRFPMDETSLSGTVALRNETLVIDDCQLDPLHNKSVDVSLGYKTRTMLVVPMRNRKSKVIGVLQLINAIDRERRVVRFDPEFIQPVESLASQAAVCLENAYLYQEITNLFDSLVRYNAKAIDARDPCTAGHSSRVAAYSVRVAKELGGFSKEEIRELRYAALFHDIGKIGVREHVLTKENKLFPQQIETLRARFEACKISVERDVYRNRTHNGASADKLHDMIIEKHREIDKIFSWIVEKNRPGFMPPEDVERMREIGAMQFVTSLGEPMNLLTQAELTALCVIKGNLTDAERTEIQSHIIHTREILKQIPFTDDLKNVPEIASKHHEKLNGKGYPDGITAEQIPLGARIVACVDIYEALTAQDRPYKPPMPPEKALSILKFEVKDGALDPTVVDAVERLIQKGKLGPKVEADAAL
ncbi:MAG: GAF domain-containing protein [Planctomycetes bacterium]|nr:GAF domain-containing protein [Planctomycetota bacterium]